MNGHGRARVEIQTVSATAPGRHGWRRPSMGSVNRNTRSPPGRFSAQSPATVRLHTMPRQMVSSQPDTAAGWLRRPIDRTCQRSALLLRRRQSRSPIRYIDDQSSGCPPGADRDGAARRRAYSTAFSSGIDEDFFYQETHPAVRGAGPAAGWTCYSPAPEPLVRARMSATPIGSSSGCHSFCTTRV